MCAGHLGIVLPKMKKFEILGGGVILSSTVRIPAPQKVCPKCSCEGHQKVLMFLWLLHMDFICC